MLAPSFVSGVLEWKKAFFHFSLSNFLQPLYASFFDHGGLGPFLAAPEVMVNEESEEIYGSGTQIKLLSDSGHVKWTRRGDGCQRLWVRKRLSVFSAKLPIRSYDIGSLTMTTRD